MKPRIEHRFHPIAVIFTAIIGGILLAVMSVTAAHFDNVVYYIAGIFGAIIGLVTSPALFLAAWKKDWMETISIVYIPSLLTAWITSNKYNPLLGAFWTVVTFIFTCVLCHFLIPNARLAADGKCLYCNYNLLGLGKHAHCPECGKTNLSIAKRARLSRSKLLLRLTPFLLIPVVAIGFHSVVSPPDLPTASMSELTKCLATNDMQLNQEASQELAFRGMDAIQQLMNHRNANVRRAVARAVRWVQHEDTASVITAFLHDSDTHVRLEAIWAIRYEARLQLRSALVDRLRVERNAMVQKELKDAISALTL